MGKKYRSFKFVSILIIAIIVSLVSLDFSKAVASSGSYTTNQYSTNTAGGYASNSNVEAQFLASTQGSSSEGESEGYIANSGFFGGSSNSQAVSINSYSIYPKSAVPGSIIRFGIEAEHAEAVWLEIELPNGTEETIMLANEDYSYYAATSLEGRYDVTFYANDSEGSVATAIDYFDIATQQTQSSSQGSGGGSSSSNPNPQCTYIWECSGWSLCSNGLQARECTNSGSCTGSEFRPLESRTCAQATTNVTVIVGDVALTAEQTIGFNLTILKNRESDPLIVQLKYTLLNERGVEIFSQIETKTLDSSINEIKDLETTLQPGNYILQVEYLYENKEGIVQERSFVIAENGNLELSGNVVFALPDISNKVKISLEIIAGLVLIASLIYIVRRSKLAKALRRESKPVIAKNINRNNELLHQMHKKVYSENGNLIGTVRDIYIEENRVYGFLIAPAANIRKLVGGKAFMVRYKHVSSVGNVVMIKGTIEEYLKETVTK